MKLALWIIAAYVALAILVVASVKAAPPPPRKAYPAAYKSQRDLLRRCAHGDNRACLKLVFYK